MPSIRHPLHYPPEYFTLIERAAVSAITTKVPCESPAAARKLRGHFYAFVGALKRAQAEYPDAFAWSQRTMCYLDGSELAFMPRDQSWQAVTVREALEAAPASGEVVPSTALPPGIAAFLESKENEK